MEWSNKKSRARKTKPVGNNEIIYDTMYAQPPYLSRKYVLLVEPRTILILHKRIEVPVEYKSWDVR